MSVWALKRDHAKDGAAFEDLQCIESSEEQPSDKKHKASMNTEKSSGLGSGRASRPEYPIGLRQF